VDDVLFFLRGNHMYRIFAIVTNRSYVIGWIVLRRNHILYIYSFLLYNIRINTTQQLQVIKFLKHIYSLTFFPISKEKMAGHRHVNLSRFKYL